MDALNESSSSLRIETAAVYRPLLAKARYKGAFGGRGSGKSHFFGGLVVEECLSEPGSLIVCIRERQITLAQSSKRLIEDKIEAFGVACGDPSNPRPRAGGAATGRLEGLARICRRNGSAATFRCSRMGDATFGPQAR